MIKLAPRPSAFVLLSIFLAAGLMCPTHAATPGPVLDQSFTSPHNLAALFNDCCKFVAQTFTAGKTGTLAGININVLSSRPPASSFPLRVAIRTVTASGEPGPTILGETTISSSSAPLSLLIRFPQTITIEAGVQYAIVANYEGAPPPTPGQALGAWTGASGDPYPGGTMYFSFFNGVSWFQPGGDLHFRTYITEILEVSLDIKPDGFPNSINPSSRGRIPVAILTTDTFDATTVDPITVRFGVAEAAQSSLEDVDGDGDTDLILHFKTQDTGIQCGDVSVTLIGETFDGQAIQGADAIRTVGCKRN